MASAPSVPRGVPSLHARVTAQSIGNSIFGDTGSCADHRNDNLASQESFPTQHVNARDRYRPADLRVDTGVEVGRTADGRLFIDTSDANRPRTAHSQSSSSPVEEGRDPPVSPPQRSSIDTGAGNRPRGLSFYDAQQFMKSGRRSRTESWHGGAPVPRVPVPNSAGHKSPLQRSPVQPLEFEGMQSPRTPPALGRARVSSANVEEGLLLDDSRLPPPMSEKANDHVSWALFMNSSSKNNLVAMLGEIVGTTMFLFFAFAGTIVANVNAPGTEDTTTIATTGFDISKLMYIALSFGFSLMVNVWVFFRISGGLFNPAVTMALFLTGAIGALRACLLFVGQMIGAIAASGLAVALFPARANVKTTLSKETTPERGVFIEAILTAELVFCILMLAKEKHKATFLAPVGIGLSLFIAELAGVYWTGGSLNPARSIGPCIVTWNWDSNHWIYWIGPLIGSLFAVTIYKVFKAMEYELANPGQDSDDMPKDPNFDPYQSVRERQRVITEKVLRSLGGQVENNQASYGYGDNNMESLGSIKLYHRLPTSSIYTTGGNAPAPGIGPFGTPLRGSEDDGYRNVPMTTPRQRI